MAGDCKRVDKNCGELVMDGREVFAGYVNAHLDAQVVYKIHVPRAGVAHHVTVLGLHEKRPLPESLGQGRKSQGREEVFAIAHHLPGVGITAFQNLGKVVARIGILRRYQGIDILPLLSPQIA